MLKHRWQLHSLIEHSLERLSSLLGAQLLRPALIVLALTSASVTKAVQPAYFDCFLEVESKVTAVYRIALDESSKQAFLQQEGGLFYQIEEVSFGTELIEIVIGEYLKRRFTIDRTTLKFSHEIEHNVGVHHSDGECWITDPSQPL